MSKTTDESETQTAQEPKNILENGGEIHFTDDDKEIYNADRIEFLPGGWIKAIFKNVYKMECYPPDAIEGIYTHTNEVEDEDWWESE